MRTPGVPIFQKKKKKNSDTGLVRVEYESGTGRVGSNTGRDKTEPKRHRFRVNLKPIYLLHLDSQPLVLFSTTPLSLLLLSFLSLLCFRFSLSLTSSLHRRCTRFSLSHFLTLPTTGYGTEGDLRTCGEPAT
jgi:hypothetical protein